MPSRYFDRNKRFPIPCPHCGQEIQETIGGIEGSPDIVCPHCSKTIDVEEFKRGLREAEKKLDDFRRRLGDTFNK